MATEMKEKLEKAIESLAAKSAGAVKSHEALHFTQAALNAANALCVIKGK